MKKKIYSASIVKGARNFNSFHIPKQDHIELNYLVLQKKGHGLLKKF